MAASPHRITAPPSPSAAASPSPSSPPPVPGASSWPSALPPSWASCWEPWLCSASCSPPPAWPRTSAAGTIARTRGEPWAGPVQGWVLWVRQGREVGCWEEIHRKMVKNPAPRGPPLVGPIWPGQGEPSLGKGLGWGIF